MHRLWLKASRLLATLKRQQTILPLPARGERAGVRGLFASKRKTHAARPRRFSLGSASAEYLVLTGVMLGVLLTPFGAENQSAVRRLLNAIKQEHSAYMYALSIPALPHGDMGGNVVGPGGGGLGGAGGDAGDGNGGNAGGGNGGHPGNGGQNDGGNGGSTLHPPGSGLGDGDLGSGLIDGSGPDLGEAQCAVSSPGDGGFSPAPGNAGATQPTQIAATHVGNPIHVVTGNKYQQEVDLAPLPGVQGLSFIRHYNSHNRFSGPLGLGWQHSYQVRLQRQGDRVYLWQGDGRRIDFRLVERKYDNDYYRAAQDADGKLIVGRAGTDWRWRDGTTLAFDREQRLLSISATSGPITRLGYDRQGRLIRIEDPQQRPLKLDYDADGQLSTVTDPSGQRIQYRYDAQHRLSEVEYPDHAIRRYHYEDARHPQALSGISVGAAATSPLPPAGEGSGVRAAPVLTRIARWTYDAQGRAASSEHAGGVNRITLGYGQNKTLVSDSDGRISVYETATIAGTPVVTAIRGPGCSACGAPGDVEYAYNERLQPIRRKTKDGTITRYTYDPDHRLSAVYRQAAGHEEQWRERYDYDGDSTRVARIHRPSVHPQGERITAFEYGPGGQPRRITESGYAPTPDGGYTTISRQTTFAYARGRPIEIDGPRHDAADITRFSYDPQGRLTTMTAPDGSVQHVLVHDAAGRPTRTEQDGRLPIEIDYDPRGRPAAIRQGARTVSYTYGPRGELTRLSTPDGQTLRLDHDAAGRPRAVRDDQGNRIAVELDAKNRLNATRITAADGELLRSVGYLYNGQGQLSGIHNAKGELERQFSYDADDRLQIIRDAAGSETRLDYGPLGQLIHLQQAGQTLATYTAEPAGPTATLTDGRNNPTTEGLDDFGQVRYRRSADTGLTRYDYNEAGNLIAQHDAQDHTTYTYDAAGRLTGKASADGVTELRYTHGLLTRIRSPGSEERFDYDEYQDLDRHTRIIDGHRFTTTYRHAQSTGRLLEKTLPDGQSLRYHYAEDSGELRAITRQDLLGSLIGDTVLVGELHRQPFGPITHLIHGNGIATRYQYDPDGRLRSLDSGRIQTLEYDYDPAGRITGIRRNQTPETYGYDPLGHLTEAKTPNGHYRYAYDSLGNRTEATENGQTVHYAYREPGQGNRLRSVQTQQEERPYAYNLAGSPITLGTKRYEYNAEQRPVRYFEQDQLIAEYRYNGFGERIKKVVYNGSKTPTVTYYLYDGHQLTAEADERGRITAQYLYLDQRPIVLLKGRTPYAIHTDHLGTPQAVTDDKGTLVWSARYAPFGRADIQTQAITLNIRFPGQYEDAESGTYYNYLRDYDPNTGRYLTSDPIGVEGGTNSYLYTYASPLAYSDRLGLEVEPDERVYPPGPFGTAVHGLFTLYVTQMAIGMSVGTDGGRFGQGPNKGNRSADAYKIIGSQGYVWELKPSTWEVGSKYNAAVKQINSYVASANSDANSMRNGITWNNGECSKLAPNNAKVAIGLVPFDGYYYEIYIHGDPLMPASGLIFYDFKKKGPASEAATIVEYLAQDESKWSISDVKYWENKTGLSGAALLMLMIFGLPAGI